MRQNYRVGESVRSVVHAAKAVSNAVNVTDISSRECKSCKIRGFLQVFSCLDILTVAVGCLDIFYDKASGNDGRFGASSKIAVVDCRVWNSLVVNGVFDVCVFQIFFDILEMLRLSQESVRHKEDVVYPVGLEMVRKFAQAPRAMNNLRFAPRHKVYADEKTFWNSLMLLEGWIPADDVDYVSKALDMKGVFFDVDDPQPDDDIPIQLSNNKFAKLFEPLTKLYMLPTYQELDLTLFFAPFFMLFFGLCLGDTGYGLLMIVALPIFTKLFQLINPNFSKWLVVLFGASTMLCGLLSGTFFGFNMYDLDIPFVQKMKEILYTDNSTMFTVSLCIGVVQILFGMAIKAVNLSIQCGVKYALGTIGWLVLLITVGVSVLAGFEFSNPVVMGILIAAAVLIFLFNSPGKNPLLNIGLGLWDTYNMATGLLGDVLSYVRLFALGLSGGILANVFNSMAVGMAPDNPVAGFIVMVLIFVIGHALNIFMNILGAIVHPMRLTFVEFFKNSGYTGGGTEYKPFKAIEN